MKVNFNKLTSMVSNSSVTKGLSRGANNFATSLGSRIDKFCQNDKFSKALNSIEPTGGDNSWLLMMGIMLTMVIGPRTAAAAKRNPDNKEATKDEIAEILFRDIQTVAIILLALKALNTVISAGAGKFSGIPMSNKPYQELFRSTSIKDKASEFIHAPFEKIGIIGKNIWDTINPLGGKISYTKEQSVEKYSGQNSLAEIKKLFAAAQEQKGNPDKIFRIVTDSLIQKQQSVINSLESKANACSNAAGAVDNKINQQLTNAKERLQDLINIQKNGYNDFKDNTTPINKATENLFVSFFKDRNNPLVKKVVNLNAWLKTLAYGIEIGYLGFGLPFLNQKRLEKKYLKTQPKEPLPNTMPEVRQASLTNTKLKAQEIKLYSNFIKN